MKIPQIAKRAAPTSPKVPITSEPPLAAKDSNIAKTTIGARLRKNTIRLKKIALPMDWPFHAMSMGEKHVIPSNIT